MNIGIIGTGAIAAIVTTALAKLETIHVRGVYSRTIEKAEQFAEKYNLPFYTNSLDDLCQQSEIDVIYVATPHSSHKEHVLIALKHDKHVLCEKPFTINEKDAQELFDFAREKKLFLGEAFWTRFNPIFQSLKDIQDQQLIGEFKSVIANIGGYGLNNDRLIDKNLAGGALLDIGVYNLNLMFEIFGHEFTEMTTVWNQGATGVDYQHTLCFAFANQATATLHATIQAQTMNGALISGSEGYLTIDHVSECNQIDIYTHQHEKIQTITKHPEMIGYEYEFLQLAACLKQGKTTFDEVPPSFTQQLLHVTDCIRQAWQLNYPGEA